MVLRVRDATVVGKDSGFVQLRSRMRLVSLVQVTSLSTIKFKNEFWDIGKRRRGQEDRRNDRKHSIKERESGILFSDTMDGIPSPSGGLCTSINITAWLTLVVFILCVKWWLLKIKHTQQQNNWVEWIWRRTKEQNIDLLICFAPEALQMGRTLEWQKSWTKNLARNQNVRLLFETENKCSI